MATWRRWSPLLVVLRGNVRTATSRRKVGGAMLRIRSWLADVARRQSETLHRALIIKRRVRFHGVGAPAPDRGAVLGGGEDQRQGDAERLGRGAPGCTGVAAYQSDAGRFLCGKVF